MYELKKNGKVVTIKFIGTGPSSYKKRIYRVTVSQKLRNTALDCVLTLPVSSILNKYPVNFTISRSSLH